MKLDDLFKKSKRKRNFSGSFTKGGFGPAFPMGNYSMSSVPGSDNSGAGAPPATDGGSAIGESTEIKKFNNILESILEENPNSTVLKQINDIFNEILQNNNNPISNNVKPNVIVNDDIIDENTVCLSDSDMAISAAAATCESALNLFEVLTGKPYLNYQDSNTTINNESINKNNEDNEEDKLFIWNSNEKPIDLQNYKNKNFYTIVDNLGDKSLGTNNKIKYKKINIDLYIPDTKEVNFNDTTELGVYVDSILARAGQYAGNLIHTLDQDILEDTKESKELNAKNEKEQSKNDKLITDDLTHPRP